MAQNGQNMDTARSWDRPPAGNIGYLTATELTPVWLLAARLSRPIVRGLHSRNRVDGHAQSKHPAMDDNSAKDKNLSLLMSRLPRGGVLAPPRNPVQYHDCHQ